MLVLTREPGTSIIVSSNGETCLLTVLKMLSYRNAVTVLINRASAARPGELDSETADLIVGSTVTVDKDVEVTLVDVREDRARIGINAPKEHSVHRLEVFQAIRQQKRRQGQDPEGGMAG